MFPEPEQIRLVGRTPAIEKQFVFFLNRLPQLLRADVQHPGPDIPSPGPLLAGGRLRRFTVHLKFVGTLIQAFDPEPVPRHALRCTLQIFRWTGRIQVSRTTCKADPFAGSLQILNLDQPTSRSEFAVL